MRQMKLLLIARDDSRYTVPASHYFIEELKQHVDLHVTHASGFLEQIVADCPFEPDLIYIHDYFENGSPTVTGIRNMSIPAAVGLHDLHFGFAFRKRLLQLEQVRYIFTHYRDAFLAWYSEFSDEMRWLPHHANTDIYKDYKQPKDIDILLTGAIYDQVYPLREKMLTRLSGRQGFVHHQHPGYRQIKNKETLLVGESYAREINRAKICLTCNSVFSYPLMKYFEIPACGSLLMAPASPELLDLGFVPGVHFVSIEDHNFEEKLDYYLNNDQERELIIANGKKLIVKTHSTKQRVQEFLQAMEEILLLESTQEKRLQP